jgi:hypothetical protein
MKISVAAPGEIDLFCKLSNSAIRLSITIYKPEVQVILEERKYLSGCPEETTYTAQISGSGDTIFTWQDPYTPDREM